MQTTLPIISSKRRTLPPALRCFLLLAGGTLPVLFMSPLHYLLTLAICWLMTKALACILV